MGEVPPQVQPDQPYDLMRNIRNQSSIAPKPPEPLIGLASR